MVIRRGCTKRGDVRAKMGRLAARGSLSKQFAVRDAPAWTYSHALAALRAISFVREHRHEALAVEPDDPLRADTGARAARAAEICGDHLVKES